MNSNSIYYKELEDEKANLLLEINKSVDTYKLWSIYLSFDVK